MIRTKRNDKNRMITDINITPFTDICLVLLIIFMINANAFSQRESGINLPIPKASASAVFPMPPLILRIEQGPKLFLNSDPVTFEKLGTAIAKMPKGPNNSLQMVVRADKSIPYEYVIQAIDLAGQSGVSDILLATRLPDNTEQTTMFHP